MTVRRAAGMLKSRFIYDWNLFLKGKMRRFYSRLAGEGSLCFDLGAHTGNRSSVWLSLGARVVALEPQPEFARVMRRKLGKNPRFTLIEEAVSDREGSATLRISYSNPAVSTISERWVATISEYDRRTTWDETREIDVTTLDALIERFGVPDFCKIDVEGTEEAVLSGCSRALPALSFEFFPSTPERAFACIDLLESRGRYGYNVSFRESFAFASASWLTAGDMRRFFGSYEGRKSGDVYAVREPGDPFGWS